MLSKLYNPALEFIICGDFNIDYLKNMVGKKPIRKLTINLQPHKHCKLPNQKYQTFCHSHW